MEKHWWTPLYGILFGVYVPEEVRRLKGRVILHISDTPFTFYGSIARLIRLLDPLWIIHTGDLADNVKLEIAPWELPRYVRSVTQLSRILRSEKRRRLAVVMGNHDHPATVRSLFPDSLLFEGKGRMKACGFDLNLSHDMPGFLTPFGRYNLFGHDPNVSDPPEEKVFFLNGIAAVNIIAVDTGRVYSLPYPEYVNDARLGKRKRGL